MRRNENLSGQTFAGLRGETFKECNITQAVAHTEVFPRCTGLTFKDCNLKNCDLPDGSVVAGGLHIHTRTIPGEGHEIEIKNTDGTTTTTIVIDEDTEEVIP